MPDDVVDDGGAGAGGDEGTSVDTPADLQTIADEFDVEALGEVTSPSPGDGQDGEGGGSPPSDNPIDTFIQQNYQGNKTAFLNSLYENRAEQKRLAEEVRDLRSRVAPTPPRDTEAEFRSLRDQEPEVRAINQRITAIDQDSKSIQDTQLKLADRASSVQVEIATLQGKLAHADDIDKPRILYDLSLKQTEMMNIETKWSVTERSRVDNENQKWGLHRELQKIEREIRDQVASEEKNKEKVGQIQQRTRSSFVTSFDDVAKEYGLRAGTDAFNYMRESVRTQIVDYLESVDDSHEGFDAAGMKDAVSRLMQSAAKAGLVRRASGKPPASPRITPRPVITPAPIARRTTTAPTESPSAPRPHTTGELLDDPDYVRRRADHIASSSARRRSGPS